MWQLLACLSTLSLFMGRQAGRTWRLNETHSPNKTRYCKFWKRYKVQQETADTWIQTKSCLRFIESVKFYTAIMLHNALSPFNRSYCKVYINVYPACALMGTVYAHFMLKYGAKMGIWSVCCTVALCYCISSTFMSHGSSIWWTMSYCISEVVK